MQISDFISEKIEQIRLTCAFAASATPPKLDIGPPIKTIGLIGGIPTANELTQSDMFYLESTLLNLINLGIEVDPDFEVVFENIQQCYGGIDFLEQASPLDMAVMCLLFNPEPAMLQHYTEATNSHQISPRHFENGIWHDTAVARGVKLISVFECGVTELGANRFLEAQNPHYFDLKLRGIGRVINPKILMRRDLLVR